MIYSLMHSGSGIGNQLHRYVAIRCLALDKGYDFSVIASDYFKGSGFMNLYMGSPTTVTYQVKEPEGKTEVVRFHDYAPNAILFEEKTNYYNPEFNFIKDNTIIDGEFQDFRYFGHRLPEIREWLKVEPMEMPEDLCVINFRGGEYKLFPDLFLSRLYWNTAMQIMKEKYPKIYFEVHTDDIFAAQDMFPLLSVFHSDIGTNWRSIRYAKHLIISNSSFAILPALLNEDIKEVIAPRYWARRSAQNPEWSMPQNYYSQFTYI